MPTKLKGSNQIIHVNVSYDLVSIIKNIMVMVIHSIRNSCVSKDMEKHIPSVRNLNIPLYTALYMHKLCM